jgi:hypothetical protein
VGGLAAAVDGRHHVDELDADDAASAETDASTSAKRPMPSSVPAEVMSMNTAK